MSILRAELKGKGTIVHHLQDGINLYSKCSGVYDGIIESTADLGLPRVKDFLPGSMLLCLANGKIYVKDSSNQWQEAAI